ncbi:MAG TPA: hypothetical protein PK587_05450 [Syntrophales bacterium]|nr:hypothetical protein [Syntrophales bacterium]
MCCTGTNLHAGFDGNRKGMEAIKGRYTGNWMEDYYGIWWEICTPDRKFIWRPDKYRSLNTAADQK